MNRTRRTRASKAINTVNRETKKNANRTARAARASRTKVKTNALVRRRTAAPNAAAVPAVVPNAGLGAAVPNAVPNAGLGKVVPGLVAGPNGFEANFIPRIQAENAARPQTTDCNLTFPLAGPFVRYRPEGYTLQLEAGVYAPREIILITLPAPINLFHSCDTDGRQLNRDYIAFYRSTATSSTSILSQLRDTWFPTFGVSPGYDIIKVSSLITKKKFTLSWKPMLDMYVNLQLKLNRAANQKQNPYVFLFGIRSDPDLLMKEISDRTSSWQFLRISAAIGGGVWDIEPGFRAFVLTHNYLNWMFVPDAFPDGVVKSPVFKTTQVCSAQAHEIPLLRCCLDPAFLMKKGDGAAMVEYTVLAV